MTLTVRLSGGELVQLDVASGDDLYEELWRQAQRGSITAALKVHDARRATDPSGVIELSEQETVAFRQALMRLARSER